MTETVIKRLTCCRIPMRLGTAEHAPRTKKFVPLFSLTVFGGAVYLLYRALCQYDTEEIVKSILAIALPNLALGGLLVASSYFSLTLFDALALSYIGAKLPYRRIALASFSALSIGHTLGFAPVSTGAIRYRFYSRWGVSAGDVTKIILFCAITVGLGLNTLAGLALLLRPEMAGKLLGFSQAVTLVLGVACLALTVLYAAVALLRRPLGTKRWLISVPPPNLALAQISVGTVNFCFVAGVLYVMLPPANEFGYLAVAAVYVLGNVASLISHVPGGLGVLEAVVVYLVPETSVIGPLVAFRALYFLVPFAIGAPLFAAYELAEQRHSANEACQPQETDAPPGCD